MHLHVYGDSHVSYLVGGKEGQQGGVYVRREASGLTLDIMKLANTGPTMRGLPNPQSRTGAGALAHQQITHTRAKDVLLVLGEVDCREKICRADDPRAEALRTVERMEQWRATLPELRSLGLTAVCPPQRSLVYDQGLWALATCVAIFNDTLREHCRVRGYRFVSMYRDVVDDCGFLDRRLELEDGTHVHLDPALAQPLALRAVLREYGVP